MSRRLPILALAFVPVILAGSMKSAAMFEKIISIHGTYLESTEPMECGPQPLGPEESSLVRMWFERVAGWPNFRHMYPMGTWATDVDSCRPPRTSAACLAELDALGVPYEPLDHAENVVTPVRITGPVDGLVLEATSDIVVDCELAARLPEVARVLREREVTAVGIMSSHRPQSEYSFHALGLALDIHWMKATHWQRALWVKSDFEKTPELLTCEAKHSTGLSRTLVGAACDLWKERIFNTVLTPNYNEGHANHLHVDVRPGDNRYYVR